MVTRGALRSTRCGPGAPFTSVPRWRATCGRNGVTAGAKRAPSAVDKLLFSAAELLGLALSSRDRTPSEAGGSDGTLSSTSARVVADDVVTQRIINLFESSYFFSGTGDDADWDVFAPDCVFADEFSSFTGTKRFRRNVSNFGKALRLTPERVCRLTKLERGVDESGRDIIIASWIFRSRVILLQGLLAASGETTYVVEGCGGDEPRITEHRERWHTSKAEVFKRLFGL